MADASSDMLSSRAIDAYHGRLDRVRAALPQKGVDALLVSHHTDIEYLIGFIGDDSLLLVTADDAVIITDSRYDEFLEPWRRQRACSVQIGIRHRLPDAVKSIAAAGKLASLGLQADHLTVVDRANLASKLSSLTLKDTVDLVGMLRRRKDAVEIESIERAIAVHQAALEAALRQIEPGMTELHVSARLDYEMKSRGAFKPSFDAIVGSGANSANIHYKTGNAAITDGVLLIDCGAQMAGYCSDLTRTFAFGRFPPQIAAIYPIVLDAQLAAIDACRPGAVCAEVDAVARKVITDAGYGRQFGHGLGHGLGKDVHESPYFNDLQTDVTLEPGMIMTVEPGIYLPGVGGVRIEDDVLITDDGCRVLSSFPKTLESAVLEPATLAR